MEVLNPQRIQRGKMLMYIGLAGLVAVHLAGLLISVMQDGLAGVDRLYLWRTAAVVVGGLGTLRGGNPVRYIYVFVLLVVAVAGISPLWEPELASLDLVMALLNVIFAVFLIYLLMLDKSVGEFLRFQRSQYFGQRVAVDQARHGSDPASAGKKKPATKPADEWDAHDDLYE